MGICIDGSTTRTKIREKMRDAVWASAHVVIHIVQAVCDITRSMIIWSYDHAWCRIDPRGRTNRYVERGNPCENKLCTKDQMRGIVGRKSMGSDCHLTEMKMLKNVGANHRTNSHIDRWPTMVDRWSTTVDHGRPWSTMLVHGRPGWPQVLVFLPAWLFHSWDVL